MKNTLTINHLNNGSVDLLSRIDSGTNQLRLEVIGGKGSQITFNTGSIVTVLSDRFIYEINSNVWTGSGNLTFTISDLNISYTFTIVKVSDTDGNIMLKKITEYKYSLVKYESINDNIDELRQQVNNNTQNITGLEHSKQDVLTPGENISIKDNVISAKDTTYTAGDNIDITDNVISVKDIEAGVDVLYGEDVPDDETDGEDKDFYFKLVEGSDSVLIEDDYEAQAEEQYPISVTSFTQISKTEFSFDITGKPSNYGAGENLSYNMRGLVEGNTYSVTFKAKYSDGTTFPYSSQYDTHCYIESDENTVDVILQSDTQQHSHSASFIAGVTNKLHFFLSSKDDVSTTLSITELEISGSSFMLGELDSLYNKYDGRWLEYKTPVMIGATSSADGQSGTVPQPTIADREKYLRGDGTWQDAQGASAVSDLTDVELTNLADKEILEYDAVAEKWKNVANSGGGGSGASTSVVETLRGKTYTEAKESKVVPFTLLGNIITSTATGQNQNSSNIQSVQKIDVTNIDYFIITVFSLQGLTSPWYPFIWVDDNDHASEVYPTVASKMQFTTTVNNFAVYIWNVSALTGEKYFGICTGGHTEFILSVEQSGTPQVVLQPIIYSEEEREVGVWIDNKPLYCKTFTMSGSGISCAKNAWTVLASISTDINCICCEGMEGDYTIWNCISVYNDSGSLKAWNVRDRAIVIKYLTLYYTKTSDTAGSGNYNTLGVPTVHYTEDEQVIGTWFGKPLYQKTIVDQIPSGQLSKSVSFAGLNIQSYVDFKCLFDNTILMDIHGAIGNPSTVRISSNSAYASYGYIDDSGVTITRSNAAYYADASIKITLKYTKTTD